MTMSIINKKTVCCLQNVHVSVGSLELSENQEIPFYSSADDVFKLSDPSLYLVQDGPKIIIMDEFEFLQVRGYLTNFLL